MLTRHSYRMMLLGAIAAVLLAAVAKRRIGAARPKYRARPDTPHAEAHEAPAAGTIDSAEFAEVPRAPGHASRGGTRGSRGRNDRLRRV